MRTSTGFAGHHHCWLGPISVSVLLFQASSLCKAQEDVDDTEVVATVNGEQIYLREVQRELQTAFGTRRIADSARPYLQAKTLAQLVDRRLIIQWLRATDRAASKAEIDLEVSRLEKRLESREISLAKHVDSIGMTDAEMRRLLEWQISWRKFLDRYLTDDNLERYFNDHRRDFDGTRMRVAHILLKVGAEAEYMETVQRANKIRDSIVQGQISFEEAAKLHSIAPTASQGGDIGFIDRHQPMHEAFSRAAFALSEHEVSDPIVTPFGVHLIRCLEIEPGQRTWAEERQALTTAISVYLFDWAASKEHSGAEIQLKDDFPHFIPGTEDLAN